MTELLFTKTGEDYVSQVIEAGGDISLEIVAPDKFTILIEESLGEQEWTPVYRNPHWDKFHMNLVGLVAGQKIRVKSSKQPTSGSYV